ncbi:MAG: hypothetical protein ABH864_02625 [archaeon]
MEKDSFTFAFLGIFLFVLLVFFIVFLMVSSRGIGEGSSTILWSALTMLVLLFGVIAISLFARRKDK